MSGKKAAEKAGQAKGTEAEDIVEAYLVEQYRPFAVNDIVQNLHNCMTKTNAVKALESLVKQNRITCKMFGKIAIYVCNEQVLVNQEEGCWEEVSFEALMQLREELIRIEKDKNEGVAQLQMILKAPSNAEISELMEARKQEIHEIELGLRDLQLHWKPEYAQTVNRIKEYEKKIGKEISARKKMWTSALTLIEEALAVKNLDEFLEDIGVEKVD
ncbi:LAME_0H03246g1_1 [Lachancea meyersii CBS 8951]|uniref:LAME_0H03246g1_1 n=1 Tax=Lachancea meyersii CBS 8951 TaxID=1266667 RepID=A0A1G4KDJ9_9SACH|nr:LAME_0H03246g1_1 [Lachancea meyersii CBS 8951]